MGYKLGNSNKIKALGETQKLTCPKCSKEVKMSVFSNLDIRAIAKLPLIKAENVYLLVCPSCASIYGVDKSNGKTFEKGTEFAIMQGDLKELTEYKI